MTQLQNSAKRVAMISGANRGIGLAIARQLSRQGYALSLGIRRPEDFDVVRTFGTAEAITAFAYEATDPQAEVYD